MTTPSPDGGSDAIADAIEDGAVDAGGPQSGAPWPLFHRTPDHAARSQVSGPAAGHVRWTFTTAGKVFDPVIARDGTIYVGSADEGFYAIDGNGTQKWRFQAGTYPSVGAIANDGTVYVTIDLGADGKGSLYALNPDGSLRWNFEGQPNDAMGFPTLGPDGTVYVGTDAALYAFDSSGHVRWSFPQGTGPSVPAIAADGTIVTCLLGQSVQALDTNGEPKWSFTHGDACDSSVAVGVDASSYFATSNLGVWALSGNGARRWNARPSGVSGTAAASPVIAADGSIYFVLSDASGNGELHAFASDGTPRWAFSVGAPVLSSPALDATGNVYVGAQSGAVYCIGPNGTERWTVSLGGGISSAPAIGADGSLFIGSSDGKLYAIGP